MYELKNIIHFVKEIKKHTKIKLSTNQPPTWEHYQPTHLKSLRQKKSQPLKKVNFKRIQIQKGTTSNGMCYQSSLISCDTKERPFQCNVLSKRLDKLRYKRAPLLP